MRGASRDSVLPIDKDAAGLAHPHEYDMWNVRAEALVAERVFREVARMRFAEVEYE